MNFSVDWQSVFVPGIGVAEVIVRGSIMYLCLFAILRFVGRRQAGHFGPAGLLVVVMIAPMLRRMVWQKTTARSPKALSWS